MLTIESPSLSWTTGHQNVGLLDGLSWNFHLLEPEWQAMHIRKQRERRRERKKSRKKANRQDERQRWRNGEGEEMKRCRELRKCKGFGERERKKWKRENIVT